MTTVNPTNERASVIIPTFERKSYLTQIIDPLLIDPLTGEVIVVIDGSTDGTLEFLEEWASRDDRIQSIFQENSGPAIAMQKGVEAARFDIVVLLDDDVEAFPGLVSGHVKAHRNRERNVILGYMPTVLPQPRKPGQVATFLYAQSYEATCFLYERDDRNVLTHLWGGNMSLRRSAALEVGMCGPLRLRRQEDMSFGLRCWKAGMLGVFDRTLTSRHLHSRTVEQFADECRKGGATRVILAREYPELLREIRPSSVVPAALVPVFELLSLSILEPALSLLLKKMISVSGNMRMWRVETLLMRILRQIEVFAGWRHELLTGGKP